MPKVLLSQDEQSDSLRSYHKHREKRVASMAVRREINRETYNQYMVEWRKKLKEAVFAAYGNVCKCCGELEKAFLSIDHIKGGGKKHRESLGSGGIAGNYQFYSWLKRNGFPQDDFRLLCMNCNFAVGKLGYCPHQVI